MKKITFSMLLWAVTLIGLNAQSFTDEKSFTFDVANFDLLRVHNKYGKVTIKATNGTKGSLTVKRKITSSSTRKLEEAKNSIYLDKVELDGELMFYVKNPDHRLEINENGRAYYNSGNGNWNDKRSQFYKVKAEFTIMVELPAATELYASTHHNELQVDGIKADVLAQNHHGSIQLKNMGSNVQAHTHHGDIEIEFSKSPSKDASFDTHHGDIKVTFPANLSADIALKTRHGDFFTDFDYEAQPMSAALTKSKKGTKYKIGGGTSIRIGQGGPKLNFETYHGSIYLLK